MPGKPPKHCRNRPPSSCSSSWSLSSEGPPCRPDVPFSARPFQAFFILAETFASTHLPRALRTIPGAGGTSESEPVVGLAFVVALALEARFVVTV